jgi:hypothetical protein
VADTDAARGRDGVNTTIESFTPDANPRVGRRTRRRRSTTYVREAYRQRKAGALKGLSNAALDVFHLVAHLLDRFARDEVVFRQSELADELCCSERTVRRGVEALTDAGLLAAAPVHGAKGYRDKTRFTLPAMPDSARFEPTGQNCPVGRPTGQNLSAYRPELAASSVGESLGSGSVAPTLPLSEQLAGKIAGVLARSSGMPDDALDGYGLSAETVADLARVVEQERAAALDRTGETVPDDVFLAAADRLATSDEPTDVVAARYRQVLRTGPLREWEAGY